MEVRITFINGVTITAEQNGNCFITAAQPAFPTDLSVVTVQEDDHTYIYHNVTVQPCASVDERYWFTFIEETEQARMIRELREENELMAGAIMELAELIGGEE